MVYRLWRLSSETNLASYTNGSNTSGSHPAESAEVLQVATQFWVWRKFAAAAHVLHKQADLDGR